MKGKEREGGYENKMTEGFFKKFCNHFGNSEECKLKTEETEQGVIAQEELYEWLLNTYGEEEVAQAYAEATAAPTPTLTPRGYGRGAQTPAQTPTPTSHSPAATPRDAGEAQRVEAQIMKKVQEMQKQKEAEKRAEGDRAREAEGLSQPKPLPPQPNGRNRMPAAPSNIEGICKMCVTPITIAIMEVLKLWFTGPNRDYIEEMVDKIGNEQIVVEEGLAKVLMKMPDSLDGIERSLEDFNTMMSEALRIAAAGSPELKARFDRERAELESGLESEAQEAEGVDEVEGIKEGV